MHNWLVIIYNWLVIFYDVYILYLFSSNDNFINKIILAIEKYR